MVNRYYTPAKLDFVDTYVPIPFQELMQIGKEINTRRDKALETINNVIGDWKKFYSPSQKDMEMWDSLTINNPAVRAVIDRATSDPNYLRTLEGQAAVAGLANSVDVGKLQQLRANAANLQQYQKNYSEILSKGLQAWDPIDVANYSTFDYTDSSGNVVKGSGMLNNTSPMLRQEIVDVVKPYVDNMKDTYLGKKDGYLWSGVSKEMARNQVAQNESAIMYNPQVQMHIAENAAARRAAGEDEATALTNATADVMAKVYRTAEEFSRRTPTADPLTLAAIKNRNSGSGSDHPDNAPMLLTNSIAITGLNATKNMRENMFYNAHPEITERLSNAQVVYNNSLTAYNNAVSSGNESLAQQLKRDLDTAQINLQKSQDDAKKQYSVWSSQSMPEQLRNAYLNSEDWSDLLDGSNAMVKDFSGNVLTGSGAMGQFVNGVGGVKKQNGELIATDTSDLDLVATYASKIAKKDLSQTNLTDNNKIQIGLRENRFRGVVIESVTRTFSPAGRDNRAELTILIPEEELFKYGSSDEMLYELETAQAVPVTYGGEITVTSRSAKSVTYDIDGNDLEDKEAKQLTENTGSSSSTKRSKKYWAVPVITRLPNTGDGTSAELFNQQSWQANMTDTQAGKLYSTNQMYNTAPLSRQY